MNKRHLIYKKALIVYKEEILKARRTDYIMYVGLCYSIEKAMHILDIYELTPLYDSTKDFPELAKYNNGNSYWWSIRDTQSRIEALENVIKETESN